MPQKQKVAKLLVQSVPLTLAVEGENEPIKLELKLAWTMRGVVLVETKLRTLGIDVNILQNPSAFWTDMNATGLAVALWAMTEQEHPEYRDEDGFDTIASFINNENKDEAGVALRKAYLETFSKKRREQIEEAIKKAEEEIANGGKPPADPTPAQGQ